MICVFFFLLSTAHQLYSDAEVKTIYTKDRYFLTTGTKDFYYSVDDVATVLLNYKDYPQWMLKGMADLDEKSEGLLIYFTDIEYFPSTDIFIITFDLNLPWPFGNKGTMQFTPHQTFNSDRTLHFLSLDLNLPWPFRSKGIMQFTPHQSFNSDSTLHSLTLTGQLNIKALGEIDFAFVLKEGADKGATIAYSVKVKFPPFLAFFFSKEAYKKNLEWYILNLAENLTVYMANNHKLLGHFPSY